MANVVRNSNLDAKLENADWTKQTWDLPDYGSEEFKRGLESSGMTDAEFRKLPAFQAWLRDHPNA